MTTQSRLLEILEIVSRATPGPWIADRDSSRPYLKAFRIKSPKSVRCVASGVCNENEDLAAIALLPELAACAREMMDEVERLREEIKQASLCVSMLVKSAGGSITIPRSTLQGADANTLFMRRVNLDRSETFFVELPSPQAFQGRQTARNRPDIPSDAGVPTRGDAQGGGE